MALNTLPRDYDLARIIDDYERRISFLERLILMSPVAASIWSGVPGGFDTGWQTITNFDANFTPQGGTNTPQVRRYGPLVMVRGRANTAAAIAGNTAVYTVPSGFSFEPINICELGRSLIPGSTSSAHRYFVSASGTASQQGLGGTAAGALCGLSAYWPVSAPA